MVRALGDTVAVVIGRRGALRKVTVNGWDSHVLAIHGDNGFRASMSTGEWSIANACREGPGDLTLGLGAIGRRSDI